MTKKRTDPRAEAACVACEINAAVGYEYGREHTCDGLRMVFTAAGDLRIDDIVEGQPRLMVNFYEWRRFSAEKKLRLLKMIAEVALQQEWDLPDAGAGNQLGVAK